MRSRVRVLGLAYAELVAIWGFALAQPLLSVYGRSPDVFIYRDAGPRQIILFTLAVCLAVPTAIWVVEMLVGLVAAQAARVVHRAGVAAGVAALVAIVLERSASLPFAAEVVLAVGAAAGAIWLYDRFLPVRSWLRLSALAVPVFAGLFLLTSAVSPLVRRDSVAVASVGGRADAPPVVMVVFDEWPTSSILGGDGRIDAARYPNLARLGRLGTFYRNATSVTNSTWHAVPEIFTGQYPKSNGVPEAYSHPQSIFTLLGGTYRLKVAETVTRVCPPQLCATRSQGTLGAVMGLLHGAADTYGSMVTGRRGNVTTGFQEENALQAAAAAGRDEKLSRADPLDVGGGMATGGNPVRFDEFLGGLEGGEPPTLHVLHMLLPHVPYRYLPTGRQYQEPDDGLGRDGDVWVDDPSPVQLAQEQLLLQTGYVDLLVGRLLDRLERTGLLRRSMVVVTADHGIAFHPGEPIRGLESGSMSNDVLAQEMWRPLLVKLPDQTTGGTSDANVMGVDIVPTIAAGLHIRIPWKVDGVPAGTRADATKYFAKSTTNPFGVEVGPRRAIDAAPLLASVLRDNADRISPPTGPHDSLRSYRVGDHGTLVGRRVSDLDVTSGSGGSGSIDGAAAYRSVDLRAPRLPAYLRGSTDRAGSFVVAVNGRVAGVSTTFADGGTDHRFAVIVPDSLLRSGRNDVRLYRLGAGDALAPVRSSG